MGQPVRLLSLVPTDVPPIKWPVQSASDAPSDPDDQRATRGGPVRYPDPMSAVRCV